MLTYIDMRPPYLVYFTSIPDRSDIKREAPNRSVNQLCSQVIPLLEKSIQQEKCNNTA
jgi:hypothetical protein